jgi:hypothetical protein
MNEELNQVENEVEEKLKVKNRFQELSEKVKLTSQERDELAQAKTALEAEKSSLAKERDFYKDFSVNVAKYPNASEYQDQILEKVKSGYSTEDAMVSVLAKEGKLMPPSEKPQPKQHIEGGSAPTIQGGTKGLSDMTADEKFAALREAESSGDLVAALRGR